VTSSLRGLALCTALVLVLALAWVLGGGRDRAARPPQVLALVPGEVRELRFTAAASGEALRLRRRGDGWESELGAPVRAAAVEDLLGVVAAARWHRRAAAARAGQIGQVVAIDGTAIGLGEALGEQRWLLVRGQALLVDGWVARVLAVEPASLLDRSVLPGAGRSPVIEVHGGAALWRAAALVMQGDALVSPARYRLDSRKARALREALGKLELLPKTSAKERGEAEPAGAAGSPDALDTTPSSGRWSIRIAQGPSGEATLIGEGPCLVAGDAEAVRSSLLGRGCVARAALLALGQLIDQATTAAEARPFAAEASEISEWQLSDPRGGALRMWRDGGRWRAQRGGEAAPFAVEDRAVERALAAWTAPWQVVLEARGAPASSGSRTLMLTAQHRDGTRLALALGADRAHPIVARREGEQLTLTPPPELSAALGGSRQAPTLASLTWQILPLGLWQLEPTAVSRLSFDDRALLRGAVLGEWLDERTGQRLPAVSAAAVEELVATVADLRARSRQPHGAAPAHRLALWSAADPSRDGDARPGEAQPPGAHHLELVARGGECLGRGDGAPARFETALCEQVRALAALLR
jgi:hypothetical protein